MPSVLPCFLRTRTSRMERHCILFADKFLIHATGWLCGLRWLCELGHAAVRSRRQGQALRFSDEITRGSGKCVKLSLGHFLWCSKLGRRAPFIRKPWSPDPTTTTCCDGVLGNEGIRGQIGGGCSLRSKTVFRTLRDTDRNIGTEKTVKEPVHFTTAFAKGVSSLLKI
jgi:hypothetical protein